MLLILWIVLSELQISVKSAALLSFFFLRHLIVLKNSLECWGIDYFNFDMSYELVSGGYRYIKRKYSWN